MRILLEHVYKRVITLLSKWEYNYLVIGGIAAGTLGEPRVTGDVDIDIMAICHHYAIPEKVAENIRIRILQHFDPFIGGDEETGWPYRRPLTVYEMAQIIEETDGVKQSESIKIDGEKIKIKKIDGLINVSSINVEVIKENK